MSLFNNALNTIYAQQWKSLFEEFKNEFAISTFEFGHYEPNAPVDNGQCWCCKYSDSHNKNACFRCKKFDRRNKQSNYVFNEKAKARFNEKIWKHK